MSKKSILIVEDELVIRSTLKKFLEKHRFKVCEAESIRDASNHDLTDFALIITDLRLPGAKGTDLIRLAAGVPVLVMTSYASLRSAVDAMKLGAVDYIPKPFNFDELLATVKEITSGRSAHRAASMPRKYVDKTVDAKPSAKASRQQQAADAAKKDLSLEDYFVSLCWTIKTP